MEGFLAAHVPGRSDRRDHEVVVAVSGDGKCIDERVLTRRDVHRSPKGFTACKVGRNGLVSHLSADGRRPGPREVGGDGVVVSGNETSRYELDEDVNDDGGARVEKPDLCAARQGHFVIADASPPGGRLDGEARRRVGVSNRRLRRRRPNGYRIRADRDEDSHEREPDEPAVESDPYGGLK